MKPLCSYPECPWRFNEEEHWPICGHVNGHPHTNEVTHQHKPRRSQMKNPPIVALLCPSMHDMVDNGTKFKDEVRQPYPGTFDGKPLPVRRFYRLWKPEDEHKPDGWALIWKEIPDGNGRREEEAGVEGVPGTLPDTGLPEGPGREELGDDDGDKHDRPRKEGLDENGQAQSYPSHVRITRGSVRGTGDLDGVTLSNRPALQSLSQEAPDFGPDYLNLPEEFTLADAVPWAAMVGKWEHGRQWYAGDLLLACEARFGHERLWGHSVSPDGKTFVDLLGMTYPSLRNCQRVCAAIPPGLRYPVSFGHHAAVYKHPNASALLSDAAALGWTVSQIRQAASGHTEPETHECPLCGAEHRVKATT